MSTDFDPYYKWLGVAPEEQPPNHYRLLGVNLFEPDPDVIAYAADARMSHVRSFQTGPHSGVSQQMLNGLAAAKVCLLNPQRKRAYDHQLRVSASGNPPIVSPPPVCPPPVYRPAETASRRPEPNVAASVVDEMPRIDTSRPLPRSSRYRRTRPSQHIWPALWMAAMAIIGVAALLFTQQERSSAVHRSANDRPTNRGPRRPIDIQAPASGAPQEDTTADREDAVSGLNPKVARPKRRPVLTLVPLAGQTDLEDESKGSEPGLNADPPTGSNGPNGEGVPPDSGQALIAPNGLATIKLPSGVEMSKEMVDIPLSLVEDMFPADAPIARLTFPNGAIRGLFTYNEGNLAGPSATFYEDGRLHVLVNYDKCSKLDGHFHLRDKQGRIVLYAEYRRGLKHGIWCLFREDQFWLIQEWARNMLSANYLVKFDNGRQTLIRETESNDKDREQIAAATKQISEIEAEMARGEKQLKRELKEWYRQEDLRLRKELARQLSSKKRPASIGSTNEKRAKDAAALDALWKNALRPYEGRPSRSPANW
jgi:hypothetical protein